MQLELVNDKYVCFVFKGCTPLFPVYFQKILLFFQYALQRVHLFSSYLFYCIIETRLEKKVTEL